MIIEAAAYRQCITLTDKLSLSRLTKGKCAYIPKSKSHRNSPTWVITTD